MKNLNYQYWEKILVKELYQLWENSKKFLPCHGPEHHLRVWLKARPFGQKKGVDLEILLAGCLFHDVAAFNPRAPAGHDVVSAKIAEKVLKKVNFPSKKIPQVLQAISSHRTNYQGFMSLEAKIIKSFDKLEAFGPIGVYRVITPLSIRRYSIEEIINWIFFDQRLKNKWEAIAFPELKKKYIADYNYSINFFKDLAKKLSMSKFKKSIISETKMYYKK